MANEMPSIVTDFELGNIYAVKGLLELVQL